MAADVDASGAAPARARCGRTRRRTATSGGRSGTRASAPRRDANGVKEVHQAGRAAGTPREAGRRRARRAGRPEQAAARRVPRRVGSPGCAWRRRRCASYRKNIRLHIAPDARRGAAGRADHRADRPRCTASWSAAAAPTTSEGEGLSPRTVRYVHTILSAALAAAVKHPPPGPQPGRRRARRRARSRRRRRRCTRGPQRSSPRSWAGRASTANFTRCGTCWR